MPIDPIKPVSSRYTPNEAETYDEWLQRQMQEGLREADDPDTVWVPHQQVISELDALRKKWRARA